MRIFKRYEITKLNVWANVFLENVNEYEIHVYAFESINCLVMERFLSSMKILYE